MKKTITILLMAFTALMANSAKSQTPGQIDLSFNPHYDGCTKYNQNNPGAVYNVNNNGSGKVYLSGDFYFYNGNSSRCIARVNTDGTYDNTFNVGTGLDSVVRSSALQSDGKILLGGAFSSYNGTTASRIIRLNTNGSIDAAFNANIGTGPDDYVRFVSLQTDGKILLGGTFTSFNGISANHVVRLNTDGTIDNTFNVGAGTDDFVRVVTEQSDGKILVGGNFLNFAGSAAGRIVRLNANGTKDLTFAPSSGFDNAVTTIAVQTDGKILVGGMFSSINGAGRNRMARLNANGTIDNSFSIGTGFADNVWKIVIAVDNKILVCGEFGAYNDSTYSVVMRMLPSGAGDTTFSNTLDNYNDAYYYTMGAFSITDGNNNGYIIGGNVSKHLDPGGDFNLDKDRYSVCGLKHNGSFDEFFNYHTDADKTVYSSTLQQDGKIIIAGKFTHFDGDTTKIGLARLNTDGTLDNTFQPEIGVFDYAGLYAEIVKVHVQTDGQILVTGLLAMRNNGHLVGNTFTTARLNTNGTIDPSFTTLNTLGGIVQASVIRADGKIYIASNGASGFIKLLNDDGTVDNSFVLTPTLTSLDAQVFYNINQLKIDANNKLLVACSGTKVNGTERSIFRINPDGTLDATFNTTIFTGQSVKAIDLNTDGSIIIGGGFSTVNGITIVNLAKLNNDGTSNLSFSAITPPGYSVNALKIQADGKIVVGGGDYSQDNLYKRYNTGGTVDNTFITHYIDYVGFSSDTKVNTINIQPDGNIILGGNFNGFSNTGTDYGVRKHNIARVFGGTAIPVAPNANAGTDDSFTCIASAVVLGGSSTTAGVSYSWSGPGIVSGGATATPTVNATGTYTLTVTDLGNGLTSTDQVIVNTNTTAPNVSAGSGSAICSGNSTTLSGSSSTAGVSYNWYGPGIVSGGSTVTPTVNAVGSYTLTVTDPANGCTANDVVSVTSTTTTPTPTGIATQSFCSGTAPTVSDLAATGTAIQWYAASTGGTALATTTALVNNTHYFASQTMSCGESAGRFDVTITVTTTATTPTGIAAQSFCSGAAPTVSDLAATGTAIQWYAASTGGTALATTTALVNNTHYFASQTVSGCGESAGRFDVTVTLTSTATTPTGIATQSFCSGTAPTVSDLAATGTAIQWYAASTGGTALATTTALVNNTHYFASQTVSGCGESTTRFDVTVTINVPATPTITKSGSTLTSSSSTGNQWYLNGTAIQGAIYQNYTFTVIGDYTVIVTDNGCSSASSAITTIISVGVAENTFGNQIKIYPSPAQDFLIIEGDFMEQVNLTMTDVTGKQVLNKTENGLAGKYLLNTESLSNGMYLLKIQGATQLMIKRVSVIH